MKVVDKRLLFINSTDRVSGSIENFMIEIPPHLLHKEKHQRMRIILNDVILPFTWYNVQPSNNTLQVTEHISNPPAPYTTTVTLIPGSYHVLQLRDHLMAQLNAALSHNYTVVFDETSAKFTFTSNNIVNPSMDVLGFGANSAHKLLGFKADSQNTFSTNTLVSSGAINMMFTDAVFLHCDLPNTNVNKGVGERESFHVSNAFAKLAVNTSPFNTIIYQNTNDDYLINVPDSHLQNMRFTLKTLNHDIITLNDEYSFTLKLEVLEDDEKQIVQQNMALGELLKLLILQMRTLKSTQ
jgi:hypothetical protein